MKISELFDELIPYFGKLENESLSGDTYILGNPDNEITGVGFGMFTTPDVVEECKRKNINFLIVHEPTFYHDSDEYTPIKVAASKKKLIEDAGLTVARYHDHAHVKGNDLIYKGEIEFSGIKGKKVKTDIWAVNRFILENSLTANELALMLEKNLGLEHIRIAGCPDKKGSKISCCFGTPGHVAEELEECDFVLTGEICEWEVGEMARDYAQMGYNKAILVMGHIGSERAGMMHLCDIVKNNHPELHAEYLECGELYSYTH